MSENKPSKTLVDAISTLSIVSRNVGYLEAFGATEAVMQPARVFLNAVCAEVDRLLWLELNPERETKF